MENTVSVQTVEFLYSALLGIGIGIFYDILRCVRSYMRKSRVITGIFDALFWICAIFALLVFILTFTEGRMRWYVLFGAFCGGFLYRAAASEIVFKVMRGMSDALIKLLSLLTRPIYLLLRQIKKLGASASSKMSEISKVHRKRKRKADKVGGKKTEKKKKKLSA